MVWAIVALYEHPSNAHAAPSHISGSMLKTPLTNVDAHTAVNLTFDKLAAQAILTCGITVSTPNPALVIRLRKANILVDAPIYRPHTVRVQYLEKTGSSEVQREEVTKWPNGVKEGTTAEGGGWHWQADEVARCVRDGKIESTVWGWDKTLVQMEIFDAVSVTEFFGTNLFTDDITRRYGSSVALNILKVPKRSQCNGHTLGFALVGMDYKVAM